MKLCVAVSSIAGDPPGYASHTVGVADTLPPSDCPDAVAGTPGHTARCCQAHRLGSDTSTQHYNRQAQSAPPTLQRLDCHARAEKRRQVTPRGHPCCLADQRAGGGEAGRARSAQRHGAVATAAGTCGCSELPAPPRYRGRRRRREAAGRRGRRVVLPQLLEPSGRLQVGGSQSAAATPSCSRFL